MVSTASNREWGSFRFNANQIQESKAKNLCNDKEATVSYLKECLSHVKGLVDTYNIDELRNGSKVYKANYMKIKANFGSKLGRTIVKGPSKDLSKRWSRAEMDIREFIYEKLQRDICKPFFADVAKGEATTPLILILHGSIK